VNPEKGKQHYIKIDSISEIDPNKMSISQINQRFIDKDNNRYALRFNKESRRMEIIQITTHQGVEIVNQVENTSIPTSQAPIPAPAFTPKEQAPTPQPVSKAPLVERRKIPRGPKTEAPEESLLGGDTDLDIIGIVESRKIDTPENTASVTGSSSAVFHVEKTEFRQPSQLVEHFIKVLGNYKERANAMIRNIQSSRIFEVTGDPSENKNIVGNLAREFEAQIFESIDKMVDLHKEMTSYPRPITYYISKAPSEMREDMKSIESDREKLDKLHLYEMQRHTAAIVIELKKLSLQLMNILNLKTDSQVKQLQYPNQLMYVDAKNASLYFSQDLDKTILEVDNWKNQK
jgi:hypothetical protein